MLQCFQERFHLATEPPLQDDAEAINSDISVALYMAAIFFHIPVDYKFRAIRDYSLFRVYLVLELLNEFDIFIRLKVFHQSLGAIIAIYKVANMRRFGRPVTMPPKVWSAWECSPRFPFLVLGSTMVLQGAGHGVGVSVDDHNALSSCGKAFILG